MSSLETQHGPVEGRCTSADEMAQRKIDKITAALRQGLQADIGYFCISSEGVHLDAYRMIIKKVGQELPSIGDDDVRPKGNSSALRYLGPGLGEVILVELLDTAPEDYRNPEGPWVVSGSRLLVVNRDNYNNGDCDMSEVIADMHQSQPTAPEILATAGL